MCNKDQESTGRPSGSFRDTADAVLGNRGLEAGAAIQNVVTANEGFKRRICELEDKLIQVSRRDDSLFQTFAQLAKNGMYANLFVVVTDPARDLIHCHAVQVKHGPYTLGDLLQRYQTLRELKNFTIQCIDRDLAMQR